MNQLTLSGDKVIVSFRYSPLLVEAVKSVTGRMYNKARKNWEIPAENAAEALSILELHQFSASEDVKRLAMAQRQEMALAQEIKSSPAEYTGALPLYDFQKIGARFLKSMHGALLADVPGLGKTIQTIAALEDTQRVLIFCPASLKYSWEQEVKKWEPRAITQVIDGDRKEREQQWKFKAVKYVIANYELLLHDYSVIPKEWEAIVCDEATRISNPMAKTVKALKTLKATKKIALTGTPISNSPQDVFSIIDWIAPRYLGSYFQFIDRYCVKEPTYHRIVGYRNLKELGDKISRFMLRRTKEEVLTDFPSKTVNSVIFDLSKDEQKLYDAVRLQILSEIKQLQIEKRTLSIIPVKMLRLKQVTGHPSLLGEDLIPSAKLQVLEDILHPVIEAGEKAIVFTQFSEMAKIIHATRHDASLIYGDVAAEERQRIVNDFNTNPDRKVLVMTEAGAYGLNLQAASYVVHYDMPWSIAKLMQREDRAHRIGQSKPVTVYTLIARDTIDEYVAKVLHKKQKISVEILQDVDRLEAEGINDDDIKAILRL